MYFKFRHDISFENLMISSKFRYIQTHQSLNITLDIFNSSNAIEDHIYYDQLTACFLTQLLFDMSLYTFNSREIIIFYFYYIIIYYYYYNTFFIKKVLIPTKLSYFPSQHSSLAFNIYSSFLLKYHPF